MLKSQITKRFCSSVMCHVSSSEIDKENGLEEVSEKEGYLS